LRARAVCGDDFPRAVKVKPEPDLFLAAAREKLGLDVGNPGEVCTDAQAARAKGLVFEDAFVGNKTGKRAGISGGLFQRDRFTLSEARTDNSLSFTSRLGSSFEPSQSRNYGHWKSRTLCSSL